MFALMWLRTTSNYQYRFGVSFSTALKELYRQGGVLRFYSGIFYALLQSPLSKFGSIAANEGSRVLVSHYLPNSSFADSLSSALGAFMSMLWRIFLMPVETCKTVLQVDGTHGFRSILVHIQSGKIGILYQGSLSVALATFLGHYPWFFTHNILDRMIPVNSLDGFLHNLIRSAIIGFFASAVSDLIVNPIRIETVYGCKQRHCQFAFVLCSSYSEGNSLFLFSAVCMYTYMNSLYQISSYRVYVFIYVLYIRMYVFTTSPSLSSSSRVRQSTFWKTETV